MKDVQQTHDDVIPVISIKMEFKTFTTKVKKYKAVEMNDGWRKQYERSLNTIKYC